MGEMATSPRGERGFRCGTSGLVVRGTGRCAPLPCWRSGSFLSHLPSSLGGGYLGRKPHLHAGSHVPVGTHLLTLPPWPHLPPSVCARAADVAVVSRTHKCRLESGHPVLCGYGCRWVGGRSSPL